MQLQGNWEQDAREVATLARAVAGEGEAWFVSRSQWRRRELAEAAARPYASLQPVVAVEPHRGRFVFGIPGGERPRAVQRQLDRMFPDCGLTFHVVLLRDDADNAEGL